MLNTFFTEPVTKNEIQETMLSLANGAPGHHEVTAEVLKSCMFNVQKSLSCLCNRLLARSIFHVKMK